MQVTEYSEKIKVGAVFDGNKVTPKWFFWGKDKHIIQKIEHSWKAKEGETPLLYFSVTDGANVYEIRLNQKTLVWFLQKVYQEG